jgi:putative chitinase
VLLSMHNSGTIETGFLEVGSARNESYGHMAMTSPASSAAKQTPDDRKLDLDERRISLEEKRLGLEQQKAIREQNFIFRNTGVIITAIVSMAAISVSALQLATNWQKDQQAAAATQRDHDNALALEVAKFMMMNAPVFRSNDGGQVDFALNVVVPLMPASVSGPILAKMASYSSGQVRRVLLDAKEVVSPTVIVSTPVAISGRTDSVARVVKLFPQIARATNGTSRLGDLLTTIGKTTLAAPDQNIALALILFQTSFLSTMVENLDYSAEALVATWPTRFHTIQEAQAYAHQPEKIANSVYAGRGGNGDAASGDGWRYRSRGYLGTWGKSEYGKAGVTAGADLLANPDLLLEPAIASRLVSDEINAVFPPSHAVGDIQGAVRRWQGGLNGLSDITTIYRTLATDEADSAVASGVGSAGKAAGAL